MPLISQISEAAAGQMNNYINNFMKVEKLSSDSDEQVPIEAKNLGRFVIKDKTTGENNNSKLKIDQNDKENNNEQTVIENFNAIENDDIGDIDEANKIELTELSSDLDHIPDKTGNATNDRNYNIEG